jgi:hypothetical protein
MGHLSLTIRRRGAACRLFHRGGCAVRSQRRLGCKASLAEASNHVALNTSSRNFQCQRTFSTATSSDRAASQQSGACQHTMAGPEQEEVPIWKIAFAGMTVGSVLGGAVWFLTKATPASSAARAGECRLAGW